MKSFIENPFIIVGYESPEFFCDRKKETASIADAFKNGRNIILTSPRRMGKTGIILNYFYLLKKEKPSVPSFYLDISSTENLMGFTKLFATSVLGQLDPNPVKILKKAAEIIKGIRPVITIDELSGNPKIGIDIVDGNEEDTLSQVFDYLKDSGKECYIALDEFQQIANYPEKNVESLLRSFIQNIHNVHFLFSGSQAHLLSEMFLSPKRPFYQSSSTKSIGPIEESVYYEFAATFFSRQGRELSEDIFKQVYSRYDGHTWYIQKIMNQIYGKSQEKIDGRMLAEAVQEILEENDFYYMTLLRIYSRVQVRLLKAIATERYVEKITAGDFITKYRLTAASSVRSALKKLLDDEIVYHSDKGYMIYDRFFGEWLRNTSQL